MAKDDKKDVYLTNDVLADVERELVKVIDAREGELLK